MWKVDESGNLVVVNGNPVWVENGEEKAINYSETLSKLNNVTSESIGRRQEIKALNEQIETLKAQKPNNDQMTDQFKQQLADKDAEIAALKSQFNESKLSEAFSNSAFIKENIAVPVDMIRATFGNRFAVEDGQIVAKDQNGNIIYSPTNYGQPASFDEAISSLVGQYAHKDSILKASGNQGGGTNNGGNSNSRKWADYTESERVALSKSNPQAFNELLKTKG